MKRYGLREDQWERIKHLLPGKEGNSGTEANRAALDNRLFVEAVLYRYRTGIPWRDLPERFGDLALRAAARSGHSYPPYSLVSKGGLEAGFRCFNLRRRQRICRH